MDDRELLVQLYRGQLSHADTWRRRLDSTTNWTVILTAALLTWIFSSPSHPHYVLLVGMLAATMFLLIEARRYRQYDVWRYRARMLEEHMFTAALAGRQDADEGWRDKLRDDLREPTAKIPFLEAFVRRLRRVHAVILGILLVAWVAKVVVFAPEQASGLEAMAIEDVSGGAVAGIVGAWALTLTVLCVLPLRRRAKGEIDDDGDFDHKDD